MDSSEPKAAKKKILIVEDDELLKDVYLRRLEMEGFDVRHVKQGTEAQAAATSYQPDLIILDMMLPGMNGLDVLAGLKNAPETNNMKVLVYSALSQDSDQQRATELGADEYIVKSYVSFTDVVDRIKHHLGV